MDGGQGISGNHTFVGDRHRERLVVLQTPILHVESSSKTDDQSSAIGMGGLGTCLYARLHKYLIFCRTYDL